MEQEVVGRTARPLSDAVGANDVHIETGISIILLKRGSIIASSCHAEEFERSFLTTKYVARTLWY